MAGRNVISNLAQRENIPLSDYLQKVLDEVGHEQKAIAERLGVSQSAVSQAMKHAGFRRIQRYIREKTS